MAWPETQCANTRQIILNSASRLFAIGGLETVSIDDIMKHAGLTRGAFYHHFSSKSQLYTEAMSNGAKTGAAMLEQASSEGLGKLVAAYLQLEHCDGSEMHCPMAFMISDSARRGGAVQQHYTQLLQAFIARLNATLPRQQAVQVAVNMIGGLALARAVEDKAFATEILDASQQACFQYLPAPQE